VTEFNLVDEAWIPVLFSDGGRGDLGLRAVLSRARDIAGIEDASPLIVAATYRLMLAVLHRALEGPTDIDQAKALLRDGLPMQQISVYLDKWRDRFWLFHDTHPFGQNPHVRGGNAEPWTKLTPEYNGSSSKVLFDHTDSRSPGARSAPECARWLVATMTFSVSGGRGYYPSPEPNGLFCLPIGRSLDQTLALNLVQYPNRDAARADSAVWERDPPTLPLTVVKRMAVGYADLYTWQARTVLLDGSVASGVEGIWFAPGVGYERSSTLTDPMQAFKVDPERGRLPVRLRDGRGTWRDFASLLPAPGAEGARTVAHALAIIGRNADQEPMSLLVVGQRNEPPNAGLDYWRMERFVLPDELRGNRVLRSELENLLNVAAEAERALWASCRSFARDSLGRGERDPDKKDIAAFMRQMPAIPLFWAGLESRFHDLLRGYGAGWEKARLRHYWLSSVRDSLDIAWRNLEALVGVEDAWAIRAIAKAQRPVRQALAALTKEIAELEPEEVAG
jgi:CRISPR system Cascade subunit CasA